eukprot:Gb_22595 [translate_table: standard]
MSKCCSHGTFPHFSLQSSHLNICYYHQDLHRGPVRPGLRPSAQFGTITRLSVHPASPVLLTKNGPLRARDSGHGGRGSIPRSLASQKDRPYPSHDRAANHRRLAIPERRVTTVDDGRGSIPRSSQFATPRSFTDDRIINDPSASSPTETLLRLLLPLNDKGHSPFKKLATKANLRIATAGSTPGGALPSIPLSFSLATILPPEPKNFDFSQGAGRVLKVTSADP